MTETSAHTLHELERETGDDLAANDYWAQSRARVLTRWLADHDPASVIDVGCGSGYLCAYIADALPTATVCGVDHDARSIALAHERDSRARFAVADAFDLPLDATRYEAAVLADVIEHFEAPADLLGAVADALAPDAPVVVSVPAYRWLFGPHDEHNQHADRYNIARLGDVADAAGYRVVRARYVNAIPLLPYAVYQRVLRRPVPAGARGGHGPVLERLKRGALAVEAGLPWPFGVSLIAELERENDG